MSRVSMIPKIPTIRNAHQHLVPKWYSHLITIGWKNPIIKNVDNPITNPNRLWLVKKSISLSVKTYANIAIRLVKMLDKDVNVIANSL